MGTTAAPCHRFRHRQRPARGADGRRPDGGVRPWAHPVMSPTRVGGRAHETHDAKKKCPKCGAPMRRTTLERHDRGETVFRYSCPKCGSRATRTVKMTSRFAPVTVLPLQLRIGDRMVDA